MLPSLLTSQEQLRIVIVPVPPRPAKPVPFVSDNCTLPQETEVLPAVTRASVGLNVSTMAVPSGILVALTPTATASNCPGEAETVRDFPAAFSASPGDAET